MDPITQIRQLLALTVQENVEEARNAGLAAARLILKHGIILTLPTESWGTSFPEPPRMKVRAPAKPKVKATPKDEWKPIKSKYDGFCKWCRKAIKKDSRILWNPSEGAYHPKCFQESEG